MMNTDDVQLQIKKKARRRLVGASVFAALVALVLPMVMDKEPAPPAQEVQIHIPGQEETPFQPAPVLVADNAAAPGTAASEATTLPSAPAGTQNPPPLPPRDEPRTQETRPRVVTPPSGTEIRTPAPGSVSAPAVQPAPAPAVTAPPPSPSPQPAEVASDRDREARRAADILAGKTPEPSSAKQGGAHVILIGAFTNEANVNNLRKKLGELGIPVYTESLNSPQGQKTRVRAGPFPDRSAADRALEKMKRIGVTGVVVAR